MCGERVRRNSVCVDFPCIVCYFDKWITDTQTRMTVHVRITKIVAVTLFGVGSCCCTSTSNNNNSGSSHEKVPLTSRTDDFFTTLLNAPASFKYVGEEALFIASSFSIHKWTWRWKYLNVKHFHENKTKSQKPKVIEIKMSKLFDDTVVNRYRHIHMLTRAPARGWLAGSRQVWQAYSGALKWIIASLAV